MRGIMRKIATVIVITAAMSMLAGCGTSDAGHAKGNNKDDIETVVPIVTQSDTDAIKEGGSKTNAGQPAAEEIAPVEEPASEEPAPEEPIESAEHKEYSLYVGWTYIQGVSGMYDPMMGDMEIYLSDGTSHIDASDYHMEEIAGGDYAYYYKINGEDVPVYTMFLHMDDESAGHYEVKILRDDIRYDIAWMSGPENYDSDCYAEIESNGVLVEESSYVDHKVRAGTGIWYYGICSIENGELYEYEYLQ